MRDLIAPIAVACALAGCVGQTETSSGGRTAALGNGDPSDGDTDPNAKAANDPTDNGGDGDPTLDPVSSPQCIANSGQLPPAFYQRLAQEEFLDYNDLQFGEAPQLFSGDLQIAYPPALVPHGSWGCCIDFVVTTSTGSYDCYYTASGAFLGCVAFGQGAV